MRTSDWSSDVCSSALPHRQRIPSPGSLPLRRGSDLRHQPLRTNRMITVKTASNALIEQALQLRRAVFVIEQQVPEEAEFDWLDESAEHLEIGSASCRNRRGKYAWSRGVAGDGK